MFRCPESDSLELPGFQQSCPIFKSQELRQCWFEIYIVGRQETWLSSQVLDLASKSNQITFVSLLEDSTAFFIAKLESGIILIKYWILINFKYGQESNDHLGIK